MDDLWQKTRHGSIAGRGFHYQDAVATYIAILGWVRQLPVLAIVPEGHEDISIQARDGWIHVQSKSRRVSQGDFTLGKVAQILIDVWTAHEAREEVQHNSRVVLVLERLISGLPLTTWEAPIIVETALAGALRPELLSRLDDPDRVEKLMSATSIVRVAEPRELSLTLLSEKLSLPRAVCDIHFHSLKSEIVRLSDENGSRRADNPALLSVSDIQRILDASTELVDFESLDEAFRKGICEVADFITPVFNDHFFEGIDVVPGHIVAGLPIDRPELTDEINEALNTNRHVLVTGPSGAGKSAAAWMAAFASRHLIRWYRVKRLESSDLSPLVRMVRAAHPTEHSPVGLVVDNLGREKQQDWDSLLAEVVHLPGVYLLGVIREEDLALIHTAPVCYQARPSLDEPLAKRIWQELRRTGATAWEDWREPYESSEGLLLEYGYLLTTGARLGSTITSQVDRRISEQRDLELQILRLVATADVWGSRVQLSALRKINECASEEDLQRTLSRLLDEHLVREASPGCYGGLHELRSRYVVEATHRFGVPTLKETITKIVASVDPESLQTFVAGVLTEGAVDDKALLADLEIRLRTNPDPEALIAGLQALRLVSFVRSASEWIQILEEEKVPNSKKVATVDFAIAGIPTDLFLPSIQAAIARMSVVMEDDLRRNLLATLGEQILKDVVERITELETAARLLATLIGVPGSPDLTAVLSSMPISLGDANVEDIGLFLSTARVLDPKLASAFVDRFGGSQTLLHRIEEERPWVGSLKIITEKDGQIVAEGVIRHVSATQQDVHADAVELCRIALNCVPQADVAACRAVDVSGDLSGFGNFHIADKRIPRRNLPSTVEVAWNRSRSRAVAALLSSQSQTKRLTAERTLLTKAASILAEAVEYWCRGQSLPLSVAKNLHQIVVDSEELPPPPLGLNAHLSPLDIGQSENTDPVDALLPGLVRVVEQLFGPLDRFALLATFVQGSLLQYANELIDSDRWHLLTETPRDAVISIKQTLMELHEIVAEIGHGAEDARADQVRVARRTLATKSSSRCAKVASKRASHRVDEMTSRLISELRERGLNVQVFRRKAENPKGFTWPPDEIAVLVELGDVFDWQAAQPHVVAACHMAFEPTRSVVAAPIRLNHVLASLGGKVQDQFFALPDVLADWTSDIPVKFSDEKTASIYWQAVGALVEVSAVVGGEPGENLHPSELDVVNDASEQFRKLVQRLLEIASEDDTGLVALALQNLEQLWDAVQKQLKACNEGYDSSPEIALAFLAPTKGQDNPTFNTAALIHLALIEIDVEPRGARERIELAIERLSAAMVSDSIEPN